MKFSKYFLVIFPLLIFSELKSDELFNQGKQVFLNAGNCTTCHSLKDAKSVANIGPNLNEIRPVLERVEAAVLNGIGVMPAYQGILSSEEIKAVAYYVSESVNN